GFRIDGHASAALRDEPHRAVQVAQQSRSIRLTKPERIAPGSGTNWLAGLCVLQTGVFIESAFVLDTGPAHAPRAEARLVSAYWWAFDQWYLTSDAAALSRLEIGEDEAYPARWAPYLTLSGGVMRTSRLHFDPAVPEEFSSAAPLRPLTRPAR
ncbi:MAG: hypothetical protein AAFQ35_14830, partial [Pseudomonadota bacterium]